MIIQFRDQITGLAIDENDAYQINAGEMRYRNLYTHEDNIIIIGTDVFYKNDTTIVKVGKYWYEKNDPEIIAKVGQQSGTCKVDAVPQGLVKSLPFEFKRMGFQTHELFDVMAKMAKKKYDRQLTQEKLNQLLNNCVACHKTYKITTE